MTFKIYCIEHVDTKRKYIGITGADERTRWKQHYSDPNSAVYDALRSDGHRMTMTVLEEVETKANALRLEQEYIERLGTAEPHGWNRQVRTRKDDSVRNVVDVCATPSNNAKDFERRLKKEWPDSYDMKYRIVRNWHPELPLLGHIKPHEKIINNISCGVFPLAHNRSHEYDSDLFTHLNYCIQYARYFKGRVEHCILVFNSYDNCYDDNKFDDKTIVCAKYAWSGLFWYLYDYKITPYYLTITDTQIRDLFKSYSTLIAMQQIRHNIPFWMECHDVFGKCIVKEPDIKEQLRHELLFRPQYSRGGF